jgi:hypothetical protein
MEKIPGFFAKNSLELDVIMHMRYLAFIILMISLVPSSLHAESRKWRSKDGSKFILADLVSHDALTVTVKRVDGKIFTLGKNDLHPDDLDFLKKIPASSPSAPQKNAPPRPAAARPADNQAVFDTLKLGDSRQTVMAKIKASRLLELTVDEVYLGRFGLNGSYRTKQTIGGSKCLLYFTWDGNNRLEELSLQTQPQPQSAYQSGIKETWKELIQLMTTLHGKPLQDAPYPAASDLPIDSSLSTHLWRLGSGGSALLGTSRSAEGYMVSIRFTSETIEPVKISP